MLKKFNVLKTFTLFILITHLSFLITLNPPLASAQCTPTGPNNSLVCPAAGILQVTELMTRMINLSVTIAFTALTVWLVWGALKFFITSGGDPKNLAHAWSSITWAFMGLVFLVLAWLSLKLIASVTGVPVTEFCLGFPPYCA